MTAPRFQTTSTPRALTSRGIQHPGVTDMKTQARVLIALLGSFAFFSHVSLVAASEQAASSQLSANKHRPPGDVYPSDIYDPHSAWRQARRLPPVNYARDFSFTEGTAADRHGNVFISDQP